MKITCKKVNASSKVHKATVTLLRERLEAAGAPDGVYKLTYNRHCRTTGGQRPPFEIVDATKTGVQLRVCAAGNGSLWRVHL